MGCYELTSYLHRLFDEIPLLRNQGIWVGIEGDSLFCDCDSQAAGKAVNITVDDHEGIANGSL